MLFSASQLLGWHFFWPEGSRCHPRHIACVLARASWLQLSSIDDTNSNHVTSSADAADCSNESEDVGWSNEHMRTHSTFGYIWYELVFWKMIQTSSTDNRNLFRPLLPQGSARSNGQPRLAMTFGDTPFHRHLLALSAEYERVVGENAELRREHFGGFCYGVGDGVGDCTCCSIWVDMSWLVLIVYGLFGLVCWERIGVGALSLKGKSAIGLGILPLARGGKGA